MMELDARVQTRPCVLCGRDVSHLPRVRDRRGRYWCKGCYNEAMLALKARRTQSAGRGTCRRRRQKRADGQSIHVSLSLEDRTAGTRQPSRSRECPDCHHALAPDAVLCVQCGHDFRSGQRLSPALDERPADPEPVSAGTSRCLARGGWWGAGVALVTVLSGIVIYVLTTTA